MGNIRNRIKNKNCNIDNSIFLKETMNEQEYDIKHKNINMLISHQKNYLILDKMMLKKICIQLNI